MQILILLRIDHRSFLSLFLNLPHARQLKSLLGAVQNVSKQNASGLNPFFVDAEGKTLFITAAPSNDALLPARQTGMSRPSHYVIKRTVMHFRICFKCWSLSHDEEVLLIFQHNSDPPAELVRI
jgi:hypothetical protein